jgi:hypothetical protein
VKILRYMAVSFLLAAMLAWGTLAIYYSYLPGAVRYAGAALFALVSAGALLFLRPKRKGVVVSLGLFAVVLIGWFSMEPSNDRNWQPDVAVLPYATFNGDMVTLHNIRDCDYRNENDYTVRHYDKTFNLNKLRSVDLFLVYWGSPLIAHTMLSFGFDGDSYLCISIETRKEVGEEYSSLKGFFRQYELTYVVADERDVVRLRTNYRNEDVYLYRLKARFETKRKVFLDYLRQVNRLKDRPEWYNALTSNCTTNIRGHTAPYNPDAKLDWRILINGHVDEFVYEQGALDQSLPFPELKARSHINAPGKAADQDPAFSREIRKGLPGMDLQKTGEVF